MSRSNSPARAPTSPTHLMQPSEGPDSAESKEEGELTPGPVVSAKEESAEEGELQPDQVTRCKKMVVVEKERVPCKIVESKPMANAVRIEKKIENVCDHTGAIQACAHQSMSGRERHMDNLNPKRGDPPTPSFC
mgnify:CR=1 FL=1